ncbi:sulfite exporter TauE/SafE family protein [Prochlorococcus sp. MIT 1223]|uniref:sulfite exporter TauE/SafE family protein n=1 Tax=Prochlorococcus sp. MIT 1223 TaxID=3096217 RepID=UPI002A75D0A4|nr:sulfite exporter TauE/SafE family protein [Prochlorococcus sp. MIT 1223]
MAILANLLSALAGGGAGLVQLPILIFLGLPFNIALATHKVASVSLGFGATVRHLQSRKLDFKLSLFILLSGLPGVYLGSQTALYLSNKFSSILLGLLTLFLGFYSLRRPNLGLQDREVKLDKINFYFGGLVLFFIGFLNGSLSSGTGLFVTMWLVHWFRLTYTNAVAYTLILVGLFWNGTGAFVLGFGGQIMWEWIPMLFVGSLIGGYLGADLSLLKGNTFVKKIFENISVLMGISLIARGFLN